MTLGELRQELSWFEGGWPDSCEVLAVTPHGSYEFDIEAVAGSPLSSTGKRRDVIMLHLQERGV
jgi:hypothetical protein